MSNFTFYLTSDIVLQTTFCQSSLETFASFYVKFSTNYHPLWPGYCRRCSHYIISTDLIIECPNVHTFIYSLLYIGCITICLSFCSVFRSQISKSMIFLLKTN